MKSRLITNINNFFHRRKGAALIPILLFLVCFYGFAQQNHYSIRGKIASSSGEALSYASVSIHGLDKTAITDHSGTYLLTELPSGRYVLTTQYLGFNDRTDTVTIVDQSVELNIVLAQKAETLETVEIVSGPHNAGLEAPLAFTLPVEKVTSRFIRENQGNTLMNTLEKLPGISALHTGVGISKPVIRGMSFNRVIVNEYGIKQEGQQWGVDHGLELDQHGVNEIEILKGPVSVLYGSDGLAGIINIKPPKIPAKDTLKGEILANYSSNNFLYGTSASLEKSNNGFWIKARLTWKDFADYRVPANEFSYNSYVLPILNQRLKNTAGKELDYSLHLGVKHNWGSSTLYFSQYGQKVGFFAGAFGIPRSYQLLDDGNARDINLPYQNINHWKIISNTVIYDGASEWMIDLGYQYNIREEHSFPHSHGQAPRSEGTLALGLKLQTWSYNIRWFHSLKPHWSLYIGSNGQLKDNSIAGFESLIPEYTAVQGGVYALQDIKMAENLYWQLGIRWDIGDQRASATEVPVFSSDSIVVDYSERNAAIHKRYKLPTISTGIAWRIKDKLDLKYNFGTAFRFPSIPELTSNGVHHGTFRHELGNPGLQVEKGILQDASIQYHSEKLEATISPFYYHFENYIYLRPSARFSPLPEAGQIYQYSEGPVNMAGLEVSLEYRFLEKWNWRSSLEYVRNQNTSLEYPLPFTPPFHVLNELEYQFSIRKKITESWIRVSWDQFSAQNRVDLNEQTTPAYSLFHLTGNIAFHLRKQIFQLQMQIINLTNTPYLNNMSRYRILNLPEQGRNIQISLSFTF